jgi:hypothetical protein
MAIHRRGRPALALVPAPAHEQPEVIAFCGHCGAQAEVASVEEAPSRVCSSCGLGLLLEASAHSAPAPGGAFIVLDSSLAVCAVSRSAEKLLATTETQAVHRHVTELIVPADAEAGGRGDLAAAVTWAARGDSGTRNVVVRPANTFGIRISARISACGPPRAALVVFASPNAPRPTPVD